MTRRTEWKSPPGRRVAAHHRVRNGAIHAHSCTKTQHSPMIRPTTTIDDRPNCSRRSTRLNGVGWSTRAAPALWCARPGYIIIARPLKKGSRLPLNPDSRQTIFAGVNYIFAPAPVLDNERFLVFQTALASHGLTFEQAQRTEKAWNLIRSKPPLQIQMKLSGPPVGQVLITSDWMEGDLQAWIDDAAIICDAVFEVWPGEKQIVLRDATIRQLYDVGGDAFEYVWEQRLGQQVGQLEFLGRPVSGGGLRLVMPPNLKASEAVQAEVKIESFLKDPKKLFVQVTMAWPQPLPPTKEFVPAKLVDKVSAFANEDVLEFLMLKGGKK